MKRGESVPKKKAKELAKELKVNWVVDLVDPPQPVVEPAEPEPDPQPTEEWLKPMEDWLLAMNQHLANALQIATAECARLATGRATAEARVRELEEVLKQMDSFVSSALPVGDAA
jgi:hypothetical protein